MQEQIQKMHQQGVSVRKIAEALGIARQTVRKFIRAAPDTEKAATEAWHSRLDWKQLGQLAASGVTVKQLHAEHAPEVKYWRFWNQLRTAVPLEPEVRLRQIHKPGERVEVDYADGIDLLDARTGELRNTYLFVGTLPFSSYVFGEFVPSQKLSSFIESHDRMWAYFGGVTPYAVVDNLKSGVQRAHRYDPDVNPTYCAYANHVGFAVLPARPYRPRDKATVEANIGAIQRNFFQEVRERNFYLLAELNDVFAQFLRRFNATVMKEHGASRAERFATEQPLLKPLPVTSFEMMEWRNAKVHPDCHVQVEKNFYSVPFRMVGQSVRVRLTPKLVEALIDGDYPLKHLRRIQGILRLHSSRHVSTAALEYGCEQAMKFGRPRLQYIKACAEHFNANGAKLKLLRPEREAGDVYLHEAKAEVAK